MGVDIGLSSLVKTPKKLEFSYLLISGLLTRMFLSSNYLDFENNFEKSVIILTATTTLLAVLFITVAPHKVLNNSILRIFIKKQSLDGIDLKNLKIRVSTTYSPAMSATLQNYWGDIFITIFLGILSLSFVIDCVIERLTSLRHDILDTILISLEPFFNLLKKVIMIGTIDSDDSYLFDPNSIIFLSIIVIILLMIQIWRVIYSERKEYHRRLDFAFYYAYFKQHEYDQWCQKVDKKLRDEQNTWLKNYEANVGIGWSTTKKLVKERKSKIYTKLNELKQGDNEEIILNTLRLYGLSIFVEYKDIQKANDFLDQCERRKENIQDYLSGDGEEMYNKLTQFFNP